MFSWFKRNQLKDPNIGNQSVGLKRCPACNTEYNDTAFVVCPTDRTMLLTVRGYGDPPPDWFSIVKSADQAVWSNRVFRRFAETMSASPFPLVTQFLEK